MTLRESFGGDVHRIHEQVDALLDREDAVLVLYDGGRVVTYAEGFGVGLRNRSMRPAFSMQ